MECQATHGNDVLCSNGYYGFQPLLNGAVAVGPGGGGGAGGGGYHEDQMMSVSNGHLAGGGQAHAGSLAWQRKRGRGDEAAGCVNGADSAAAGLLNGTSAKRLCPDLYHAKLQTAMGLNCSIPPHHSGAPFENGTDSMLMMTDEGDGPFVNGVETLRRSNGHATPQDVVTLGASHLPPNHTCCSTRAQLCTMSLQQSYLLSSSRDCARCLAGEPAPYLSTQQTVENLSKIY